MQIDERHLSPPSDSLGDLSLSLSFSDLQADAEKAFEAGDQTRASLLFAALCTTRPDSPAGLGGLVKIAEAEGHWTELLRLTMQAAEVFEHHSWWRAKQESAIANILESAEEWRCCRILSAFPDSREALRVCANHALEREDHAEARRLFERLATVDPKGTRGLRGQLQTAEATGRWQDVLELSRDAESQFVDSSFWQPFRGRALRALGLDVDAAAFFSSLRTNGSESSVAYQDHCKTLLRNNELSTVLALSLIHI